MKAALLEAKPGRYAAPAGSGASRKSVLYLCRFAGFARGGAERQALALAARLRKHGLWIEVVAEDARDGNGFPPGSECRRLLRTPRVRHLSTLVYWARLAAHLWRHHREIGVLHFAGVDAEKVVFVRMARLLGIRTVLKIMLAGEEGDLESLGSGLARRAGLATLRRIDRFVAVSRRIEQTLLDLGIERSRVVYAPNGVDVDRFRTSREEARRALLALTGFPDDALIVASAGRLMPQKAFHELLSAFARLAGRHSRAHLVVLGEGPLRGDLASQARELEIDGRLALPGHVPDLAPLLPGADLFVLASRSEGLSNALLEAMASGLPVVATATSGTEDAVRSGIDGVRVDPGDGEALAAAIDSLLVSPELRAELGRAARGRVCESFSLDVAAAAHRRLYADLGAS